jgi:hypothetical protein
LVPNIVGAAAKAIDPELKQIDNIKETLQSKIPFASKSLFPKRDVWGEAIEKGERDIMGAIYRAASPIYVSRKTKDPAKNEVARLKIGVDAPKKKIVIKKYDPNTKLSKSEEIELPDDQYDYYAENAGRTSLDKVSALINTPAYKNADDDKKRDMIKDKITSSKAIARELVKNKYYRSDK